MKKITIIICALCTIYSSFSCSDMLESNSDRQVFDPTLSEKTDSVYYALGILKGIQQLADHYFFQGEMRGDLVATTPYTDNNLRQLADFSATTSNKYDSAYVYYRVINNCNYYIAHRDTSLRTGNQYVAMPEYVAVKSIRAWAYLQLARIYGKVPFYTEPLMQISQIDNNNYPELGLDDIVDQLVPDLEQYSGNTDYNVPNLGGASPGSSILNTSKIFIPVDVILGELYLEKGDFSNAISHYLTYLTEIADENSINTNYAQSPVSGFSASMTLPSDFSIALTSTGWSSIFSGINNEIITYIQMADSRQKGTVTEIPKIFGYDYYSTSAGNIDEIQLIPSQSYKELSDDQDYYYVSSTVQTGTPVINSTKAFGDTRYKGIVNEDTEADSTIVRITKNRYARVLLYRNTTILLHLAEAFNGLGLYDAAFAILKDGLSRDLIDSKDEGGPAYIRESTRDVLQILLSDVNRFPKGGGWGVHMHGAGYVYDHNVRTPDLETSYISGLSPYQLDTIVSVKLKQIADEYAVQVGTTDKDTINAVEDLLCDEYALEFAFEGTRFYDLCRLARHKNDRRLYGDNFGSEWLARKLAYKNPQKDLTDPKNWYLPFK